MMEISESLSEFENMVTKYMGKSEIRSKIQEMKNRNQKILILNIDDIRQHSPDLLEMIIKTPMRIIPTFNSHLLEITNELQNNNEKSKVQKENNILLNKQIPYSVSFEGTFGRNMISPRGLSAELTNQFVCVQGIVTRMSIVRPKLQYSVHYAENIKQGTVKNYSDQYSIEGSNTGAINGNFEGQSSSIMSNAVPKKDINGHPLSFEYGLSFFRDFQTVLVQEPPERTPVGQLPRSVEVILRDDLVDKIKPGDRIQVVGVYKCVNSMSTSFSGIVRSLLVATNIQSITSEMEKPNFSGEDLRNIKELSSKSDIFEILASSLSPAIYGHQFIKKALILQLLGGKEKNLENGTHLRGDINILLVGDPSTAKSQFLRHILAIHPNAINTTGRGSSGVGLTAAVVVDKDTGERHLEAGAMVLADRGIVCIDEFDKMNDADRVAIHEVMEQQTVTIAKAGIHVSLNARCSVLAAANPIYGEYVPEIPAAKNIGLPDSLLSRFDLCFIVIDEHTPELDRNIAERVLCNHMYPVDTPTIVNQYDERIIEPEIHVDDHADSQIYEKQNALINGESKKEVLTRSFLRKYLHYAKITSTPDISEEACSYITTAWSLLRAKTDTDDEQSKKTQTVPITVRTLETLIRLSTAHAKLRLAKVISKRDCEIAFELLTYALYSETGKDFNEVDSNIEMEDVNEKRGRKGIQNSGKKTASKGMIEDDEDEEDDIVSEKRRGRKINMDIDQVLDSKPIGGPIPDSHVKFVYKLAYENTKHDKNKSISLDDLWRKLETHKDFATLGIASKSFLLDVVLHLDNEGKVFYSDKDNQIIII